MTTIAANASFAPAAPVRSGSLLKRILNAVVRSRIETARREVRRFDLMYRESALTLDAYRPIDLDATDLLPFADQR